LLLLAKQPRRVSPRELPSAAKVLTCQLTVSRRCIASDHLRRRRTLVSSDEFAQSTAGRGKSRFRGGRFGSARAPGNLLAMPFQEFGISLSSLPSNECRAYVRMTRKHEGWRLLYKSDLYRTNLLSKAECRLDSPYSDSSIKRRTISVGGVVTNAPLETLNSPDGTIPKRNAVLRAKAGV
jgi:hypothetical protein